MPVSALMAIIDTLFSDNKRNSIICDPWLGHCSRGILKKNTSVTNQKGIEETFIHSVVNLLILSGSQSVSQLVNMSVQEACAVCIVFRIRSEIGYRKSHMNPLFSG